MIKQRKTSLFDIDKIIDKFDVEAEQKVADLGCGNFGYFVFPLAKKVGKEGKVFAVDIMKDSLKEIQAKAREENLIQIKPVWSDLEIYKATKIESESVDSASLINVLNKSHKKPSIIKESTRILKHGGRLIIVDWKKEDSPLGPNNNQRVKKSELIDICLNNGLKLEEEFEAGSYHYGLILIKV
ncbi:MAG: methyltransferase domain-containing protein [Patescibacteria group bacterium]|jgi:ubiquinone/menaquinone biosynthesis C-methylase UbiE|nr:methyltransferase domain-containing protein [Patescibacteria group bacterium]